MQPLVRVALSITFQYRVNERYVKYVTDRQADKYQKNKTKQNIVTIKMYSKIRVEWAAAHFDLGLT